MQLLVCILLVWVQNSRADHNNSPLDHALNFHCGTSDCTADTSDRITTNIAMRLEGSGFHRRLHYSIELTCLDQSDLRPPLKLAIIQPLPAAIYANVYELDSDSLAGNGPEVRLFGEVDVESIEKFAQPTTLATYSIASVAVTEKEGSAVGSACGTVDISIPLHGRYPRAVFSTITSGNLGWKELFKGLLVDIPLQTPIVLVQSAGEKQWSRAKDDETTQSNSILWSLPAGDMRLQSVTAVITAAVVCAAAAGVVHSILFSSSLEKKKRV